MDEEKKIEVEKIARSQVVEAVEQVLMPMFMKIDGRLDNIENRLVSVDDRLNGLEDDMGTVKMRLKVVEDKIDKLGDSSLMVADHERRIKTLERVRL